MGRTSYFLKVTAERPKDPSRTQQLGKSRQMVCAARACARPGFAPPLPLRVLLLVPGPRSRTRVRGRVRRTPARPPLPLRVPGGRFALRQLRSCLPRAAKYPCAKSPALGSETAALCQSRIPTYRTPPAWRWSVTHVRHPSILYLGAQALSYICPQLSNSVPCLGKEDLSLPSPRLS